MEASRKQGGNAPGPGGSSSGSVSYLTPKDMGPCSAPLPPGHPPYYSGSAPSLSPTATMARELLLNGQATKADAPLPMKGKNPTLACGVSVQPAQQLDYLAHIQGFQVRCRPSCQFALMTLLCSPIQRIYTLKLLQLHQIILHAPPEPKWVWHKHLRVSGVFFITELHRHMEEKLARTLNALFATALDRVPRFCLSQHSTPLIPADDFYQVKWKHFILTCSVYFERPLLLLWAFLCMCNLIKMY